MIIKWHGWQLKLTVNVTGKKGDTLQFEVNDPNIERAIQLAKNKADRINTEEQNDKFIS